MAVTTLSRPVPSVEGFDLEVDSFADPRVPVGDESSEIEAVEEQHAVGSVVRPGAGIVGFWGDHQILPVSDRLARFDPDV